MTRCPYMELNLSLKWWFAEVTWERRSNTTTIIGTQLKFAKSLVSIPAEAQHSCYQMCDLPCVPGRAIVNLPGPETDDAIL